MVDETKQNPEDILTDDEQLEAARERLREAQNLLAYATADNIGELNKEYNEALTNLGSIVEAMRVKSGFKQQQEKKPRNWLNLFPTSKVYAQLGNLQSLYDGLKIQHDNLKISVEQEEQQERDIT